MEITKVLKKSERNDTNPTKTYTILSLKQQFNNNEIVKFLKFGDQHAVLVNQNNEIFVYGSNEYGQISNDENEQDNFIKIDYNFGNIIHLECGNDSTLIVNDKNEFYFTGSFDFINSDKFIKMNDIKIKGEIKYIKCGYNFFIIVMKEGLIYGIGNSSKGQFGKNIIFNELTNLSILNYYKIKDLQCGFEHSSFIDIFDDIYVSGWNAYGQLGLGDTINRYDYTKVNLNFKVKNLYCYMNNNLITSYEGDIYGCGFNKYGQIGTGDNEHKLVFTKIILNFVNSGEIFDSFLKSYGAYSIIKTKTNNLYVTGDNENEITGMDLSSCKVMDDSAYYLDTFVKLDYFKTNRKYIYPLFLYEELMIATCDYLINGEKEENNVLAFKCLRTLNNEQLTDITISCCCYDGEDNFRKRKRNDNNFTKDKFNKY